MESHRTLLEQSLQHPEEFWDEQARRIEWRTPYARVLDHSHAPFTRWFVGGTTNLCYNAIDRHLTERGTQTALVNVSSETGETRRYSYLELHREVNRMAAVLQSLGVKRGERVLIYLPMIAEAAFAMLACARLGAIHSVVFGGFAAGSLATRIDDARPVLVISADAGFQGGRKIAYKPLLDEALSMASHRPARVLMIDRGLQAFDRIAGRDCDFHELAHRFSEAKVACTWLESSEPSYILYTSGTTGRPKGVQRDVGGHAVALATSMALIFGAKAGDTMFTTSDIGWVVGHSYGVYGPLIMGMTTIMAEGAPTRPDHGYWWRLVETYGVNLMLTAPTAMRLLKRQGGGFAQQADLSSLRALFLAGEPLDEPTARWVEKALGKPVIDHYWQTESGSPMLALPQAASELVRKVGSPGLPVFGFNLKVVDQQSGDPCLPGERGVLVADGPLPPGCLHTLWENSADFMRSYWTCREGRWRYSTFDYATVDDEGYIRVLGRSDDIILVAGRRLGTREIEEVMLAHPSVAEAAVIGVPNALRGQVPLAFVVRTQQAKMDGGQDALEAELVRVIGQKLGSLARPRSVVFVDALPRTQSGKVLRRTIQTVVRDVAQENLAGQINQLAA
ncbi:MAG: propionate--CoA ligase [Oxalicibacterium faecigallinarum]|uniref:propionate--CoA ligase n=1 Tax=Oxalicibacterium faecigallinarum TaxID=573741 RepID=UPI00280912F5|nr:propionate--CoA ligase [Oxalicibacterium faecigallinarum]MDQ7969064.1 propionate--CoA ligase [Oxalicibacterium faecigallinarum]